MSRIKVLLASLPKMLEEIAEDAIARRDDMTVVARVRGSDATPGATAAALADAIARNEPGIVVLGLAPGETVETRRQIVQDRPQLKLLGVTPDGREVSLFELKPVVTHLGNISPDRLVDAIRRAFD